VHILTKIFIVLVTLLAVAMVPLVATYTMNENSYRTKYRSADNQRRVATVRAQDAETSLATQRIQLQQEIDSRQSIIDSLRNQHAEAVASLNALQAQIGTLESQIVQGNANLQSLTSATKVNSELKERFVNENYSLRSDVIDSERMVMEMEDQLEQARYEADEARRASQKAKEERFNMEKQLDTLQAKIDAYIAQHGDLDAVVSIEAGLAPNRTMTSTVLTVSRNNEDVLVEINAGSRDGVQKGWIMTVGDEGVFLGRLQIEEVDINRSIGRVTLEDASRGLVVPGTTVFATKGRN